MPFKSEKQRRYLWANEPEIARDWTDTYGSGIHKALGGRIGFQEGDQVDSVKHAVMLEQIDKLEKMIAAGVDSDGSLQKSLDRLWATPTTGLGTGPVEEVEEVEESEVLEPDLTQVNKMSMIPSWEDLKYNLERLAEPGMEKFDTWEGSQGQQLYDKNYRDIKGARSFNVVPTPSEESLMMGDLDAAYGLEQMKNLWGGEPEAATGIMKAGGYPFIDPADGNFIPRDPRLAEYASSDDYENINRFTETAEEDDESDSSNWIRSMLSNYFTSKIHPMLSWAGNFAPTNLKDSRFYRSAPSWTPAYTQRGTPMQNYGYSAAQLNKMNALGGHYSDPARRHRQMQARQTNILNRAAAGKPVGNVHLLGPNYKSDGQGGLSYTGPAPTRSQIEAGATTRQDKGWQHSSFAHGGLASLWRR